MEVTPTIDTVEETPGRSCVKWSTDEEVDHNLRRGMGISEQGGLSVGEWFELKHLKTLQRCVSVMRASHAVAPFSQRTPYPLRGFLLKSFYRGCYAYFLKRVLNKVKTINGMEL